ncbi:hypothetical protein [Riemerella columbina]|uniref:hypothetical protein n=1 Tax=Riemerella columbina TaxID=103810 RepID=UPI00036ED6CB|nr:hypothetical protein [Riemerella columbina]
MPENLYHQNFDASRALYLLFQPFTNPVNYAIYDEFKWYLCPELDSHNLINLHSIDFDTKVQFTKNRLKLANILRFSPKYSWNTKSEEGITQLVASVIFLSENFLLDVLHSFSWSNYRDIISEDKKDKKRVNSMNKFIDSYEDFRVHKPFIYPDDWADQ